MQLPELERGITIPPNPSTVMSMVLKDIDRFGLNQKSVADIFSLIPPSVVHDDPQLFVAHRQWWFLLYIIFFTTKKPIEAVALYEMLSAPHRRQLFVAYNQMVWLLKKDNESMARYFAHFATVVHCQLNGQYVEAYNVAVHDSCLVSLPEQHMTSLRILRRERKRLLHLRKRVHTGTFCS